MCKNIFLFLIVGTFLLTFISSESMSYGKPTDSINYGGNYTIDVNNTIYHQGYTVLSLRSFFESTLNNLVNYYNKTDIDNFNASWSSTTNESYVPYIGANKNVNLGNNSLTVNGTTLFVNTTTGKVGIGTTSPIGKLHVVGNTSITGGNFSVDTNTLFVDSNNNRVGIGTTTPAAALTVSGVGSTVAGLVDFQVIGTGTVGAGFNLISTATGGKTVSYGSTGPAVPYGAGLFAVYMSPNYISLMDSYGRFLNIGAPPTTVYPFLGQLTTIPTNSTTKGIVIRGVASQSANLFEVQDSTVNSLMMVSAAGRVGIGTPNPFTNLHVNGSILANGTITTTNGAILNNSVNITGNLNITGNISGSSFYTGMWFYDPTDYQFNLNTTYQKISNTNQGDTNGFLFLNNNTLELVDGLGAGEYTVNWRTFGLGTQNHVYEGFVYINEIQQNNTAGMGIGQASSAVRIDGSGHIRLNKYDNITIRLADTSGTSTVTAYLGNVLVERIAN